MEKEFFSEHWNCEAIVMNADGSVDISEKLLNSYRAKELDGEIARIDAEVLEKGDADSVWLEHASMRRMALSAERAALQARRAYFERIGASLSKDGIGDLVEFGKSYQRMTKGKITGMAVFISRDCLKERFRCPRVVMLKRDGTPSAYSGFAPEGSYRKTGKGAKPSSPGM